MSVVLTQCPVACPPCGGGTCVGTVPNPCTANVDPTTGACPTVTNSMVWGSTATPLTTPLPAAGPVSVSGVYTFTAPGTTDSTQPPSPASCYFFGGHFRAANNPHFIFPTGGGTYLQGFGANGYDNFTGVLNGIYTITVDASAGVNYNAWLAHGFAPLTAVIDEFGITAACCCGWVGCGASNLSSVWQMAATATYAWVFNSGTGLYDATMTATGQLQCGPP